MKKGIIRKGIEIALAIVICMTGFFMYDLTCEAICAEEDHVWGEWEKWEHPVYYDESRQCSVCRCVELRNNDWAGESATCEVSLVGGHFQVDTKSGSADIPNHWTQELAVGRTIGESMKFHDPKYWTEDNEFLGWTLYKMKDMWLEDNGYVSEGLLTTEEVMAYEVEEGTVQLILTAVWSGDYEDYYTKVEFETYGRMDIDLISHEWYGEDVEDSASWDMWSVDLMQNGTTIREALRDDAECSYTIVSDPVRSNSDAKFEGWVEITCRTYETTYEDESFSHEEYIVSDNILTTEEMLNRTVPEEKTLYAAKWSDMPIEEYYEDEYRVYFYPADGSLSTQYSSNASMIYEKIKTGRTLNETWEKSGDYVKAKNFKCAQFNGWKVYQYEDRGSDVTVNLTDGETVKNTEQKTYVFINSYENDSKTYAEYAVLYNASEFEDLMSSEEVLAMPITGNTLICPEWEYEHVSDLGNSIENVVAATETKPGCQDRVYRCEACGKELSRKKELIPCPNDPDNPFIDVDMNDWYSSYAKYVYENGLMSGTSTVTFAPNMNLSRSQFATILWRMNDSPVMEYSNVFSDVPEGEWYTNAVIWASETGVVLGKGDGTFGVTDNITREQMALMMYRYAAAQEYDIDKSADISGFKDDDKVSSWAKEAVKWAVANKIINGKGTTGLLDPQGKASRAECATIIKNFMETYQ